MSRFLNELLETNGSLSQQTPVGRDIVERYAGRVPDLMCELWAEIGIGAWKHGLLRLCLPEEFAPVLTYVFGDDPELRPAECHVIAYSAFGTLIFWSEEHWVGTVDLVRNQINCNKLLYPEEGKDPNIALAFKLHDPEPDIFDFFDTRDKPLFKRARKKLGDLHFGECFGFVPILAFGGAPELDSIKRMPALEHFSVLAQTVTFTIWDYLSNPIGPVRTLDH